MHKRKIRKSIESFKKLKEKHEEKIRNYEGENYSLKDYWTKELREIEKKIKEKEDELKK